MFETFGTLTVCCNLSTTSGGAVAQTGTLTVNGTTSINAGGNPITLTNAANDFVGAITSLTGGTTAITDANTLTFGTVNTGGLSTVNTGALSFGTANTAGITVNTNGGVLTPGTINAGAGAVNLTVGGISTAGSISGAVANLSSASQVGGGGTTLATNFGAGSVVLTGSASSWNLSGPSVPQPTFTPSSQSTGANVFYNNGCISGPACAGVFSVTASIGSSVAQIAAQALKDAQSTDSVAKQIDYGFAGDVGTTPPMDHRIDETGISTPDCFEESRENTACK